MINLEDISKGPVMKETTDVWIHKIIQDLGNKAKKELIKLPFLGLAGLLTEGVIYLNRNIAMEINHNGNIMEYLPQITTILWGGILLAGIKIAYDTYQIRMSASRLKEEYKTNPKEVVAREFKMELLK